MYKNILVGYDGSDGSTLALEKGIYLAKILGADLSALWVKNSLPHYPETIDEIQEEKEAADSFFQLRQSEIKSYSEKDNLTVNFSCVAGHPAKTILDYAKDNKIDLIILGQHGYSSLWGNILGHIADKVCNHAHCSILIVSNQPEVV